ncbi:response regulator transcription factor, partial [Bacteroidota bacterium]
KKKILLVDDEKDIVEFLEYNLVSEGFDLIKAYNGKEALEQLNHKPDLVILDVLMPKMSGYEVCKLMKGNKEFQNIPVIFLTAKSGEADEIHGLNIGAADFIQKPISPQILVARVKSNLRNVTQDSSITGTEREIKIGPLEINREKYTVSLKGKELVLPRKEFEILFYLAANPGKVFPRDRILSDVWGDDVFVIERTVDVHVRKIREKFGKYADLIETIKGVGYRFKSVE